MVRKWLLPTVVEILTKAESTAVDPLSAGESYRPPTLDAAQWHQASQRWYVGLMALGHLLHHLQTSHAPAHTASPWGLMLCGPALPFEPTPELVTALFTPTPSGPLLLPDPSAAPRQPCPLPLEVPLLPVDPLQQDAFCLLLTGEFGLVLSLGLDTYGMPRWQFSFDPADVHLAWQSLRGRLMLTAPAHLPSLDALVAQLAPVNPSYHWVQHFSTCLFEQLPLATSPVEKAPAAATPAPRDVPGESTAQNRSDLELLQAITHEVRTPLATIRTLTRSLLRRADLDGLVRKRLDSIDRECTEQINRMELIFQAVELADGQAVDLTAMSFGHLIEQSLPLWQQQAERRNLNLAVAMPQQLPAVVSNPTILDKVLTGLVENFTRNLPAGSHIQVQVTPVGDRLKLQVSSTLEDSDRPCPEAASKEVGQLLTFRPATGNLSLNLKVTQELFQTLGGKLVVKPNQRQGETMTIFLPME